MDPWSSGREGETLLGVREIAGEVEGLSHRSLMCGIMVIWGQDVERRVVKCSRSKKWVNGTAAGDSVAPMGIISGMMKFGAVRFR